MDFVQLLVAYLAATSGMSQDEVAALVKKADGSINTEGVEVFTKANTAFKAKMQNVEKEAKDAMEAAKTTAHNAGLRNGAEKVEKALRDRLKIESELSGDDLLKAVEGKATPVKGSELTKETVEASTFYIAGVNNAKAQAIAEAEKAKSDLEAFKKDIETRDMLAEVLGQSNPIIDELNLDFSEDPHRAKAQREVIEARLKEHQYKTERDADGKLKIVGILNKDGSLAKDDSGNPLTHRAMVERVSLALYDQRKGEQRSGGVKPPVKKEGDKKGEWKRDMPKNESEYLKLVSDQSIDLDERIALQATWEAANGDQ